MNESSSESDETGSNRYRQSMHGLLLVIPDKPDEERDAVAAAWERRGGTVLRLGRFWDPPVVDPARVRNGKWVVVECNATWGAGLNGCDAAAAVACIEAACFV